TSCASTPGLGRLGTKGKGMTSTAHEDQFLPHPDDVAQAQPKRRPYNASASLSEYGVFPECDAAPAAQPAASAEPSDEEIAAVLGDVLGKDVRPTAVTVDFARALLSRYAAPQASDEELARLWRQVSGRETLRPDS